MDLVELLQRDIQAWKEKWAKLKEENVNLQGFKAMVMEDPKKYSQSSGTCVTAELKKDRIGHNGPPESIFEEERSKFRDGKKMYEKEHKLRQEAEISLANALEVNESHRKLNGKLQVRLTEVEEDNKKLAHQVEDFKLNRVRKAGL